MYDIVMEGLVSDGRGGGGVHCPCRLSAVTCGGGALATSHTHYTSLRSHTVPACQSSMLVFLQSDSMSVRQ